MDVVGTEGVGGDRGDECGVDTAGQADADVGETALDDIVAGGGDECAVQLGHRLEGRDGRRHRMVGTVDRPGNLHDRETGF